MSELKKIPKLLDARYFDNKKQISSYAGNLFSTSSFKIPAIFLKKAYSPKEICWFKEFTKI